MNNTLRPITRTSDPVLYDLPPTRAFFLHKQDGPRILGGPSEVFNNGAVIQRQTGSDHVSAERHRSAILRLALVNKITGCAGHSSFGTFALGTLVLCRICPSDAKGRNETTGNDVDTVKTMSPVSESSSGCAGALPVGGDCQQIRRVASFVMMSPRRPRGGCTSGGAALSESPRRSKLISWDHPCLPRSARSRIRRPSPAATQQAVWEMADEEIETESGSAYSPRGEFQVVEACAVKSELEDGQVDVAGLSDDLKSNVVSVSG